MPNSLENALPEQPRQRKTITPRWHANRENPAVLSIIDGPVFSKKNQRTLTRELLRLKNGAEYFDPTDPEVFIREHNSIPSALLHLWSIAETHGIGGNTAKAFTSRLPKGLHIPKDRDGITIVTLEGPLLYGVSRGLNVAAGMVHPNSAITVMPDTHAQVLAVGGAVMFYNSEPPQDNISHLELDHTPPSAGGVAHRLIQTA